MQIKLILFTLAMAILQACLIYLLELKWSYLYPVYLIYFFFFSWIMNKKLIATINQRPQAFVTTFMGFMAAKLFLSLALLLVTLWFNRDIKVPLAMFFLITYLLFTSFSVITLFARLKDRNTG